MNNILYDLPPIKFSEMKEFKPGVFVTALHGGEKMSGVIIESLPNGRCRVLLDDGHIHEIHSWCLLIEA